MPSPATFESFEKELGRLVAKFEKEHSDVTSPGYTEADEKKRAVLQNAVAATDRKIDDLVYELYGLTEEEIELVEGAAR